MQKRFHYPGWDVHRRSWDFINVINLFSLWPISLKWVSPQQGAVLPLTHQPSPGGHSGARDGSRQNPIWVVQTSWVALGLLLHLWFSRKCSTTVGFYCHVHTACTQSHDYFNCVLPKDPLRILQFLPSGPLHFIYVFPWSNFVFNYNQLYIEKFTEPDPKRPLEVRNGFFPSDCVQLCPLSTQHTDWKTFGTATEKSFWSKRFLFKWEILLLPSSFLFAI